MQVLAVVEVCRCDLQRGHACCLRMRCRSVYSGMIWWAARLGNVVWGIHRVWQMQQSATTSAHHHDWQVI